MLRLILTLLFSLWFAYPAFCSEQWLVGRPLTGDNPVNFPAAALANNDSIDRLLANYRQGMTLTYVNASSASVAAGSIVCNNAGVHTLRQNTSSTTITTANLDTGNSFNASTTYYVYSNCSADATTATFTISLNGSAPSGVTAYVLLGNFTTDNSSNIGNIVNTNYFVPSVALSNGSSFNSGTVYQNTSNQKIDVVWYGSTNTSGGWAEMNQLGQIGSTNSPSTTVAACQLEIANSSSGNKCGGSFIVPSGWYWQITNSGGNVNGTSGSIGRIETWNLE